MRRLQSSSPIFFVRCENDFEALCEFLEDKSFDIFQSSDLLTESHILTFGSIKSFDTQYNHETLFHPLPLLPDMPQRKSSFWKMAWWNRPTKTSQSRQTDTLAALARATNSDRSEVVENHLVAAYRKFEEDQITSPTKADEPNNPEPISGRKVRWILIYAIHQTLRRATEVALEVRDATGVPYHLCISTVDLPPWKEEQSVHALVHAQLDRALLSSPPLSSPPSGAKSDNDYSSLANQATMSTKERPRSNIFENFMPRGYSALRRSFSLRTTQGTERPHSEVLKPCRETVAHGNGNKMNTAAKNKELAAEIQSMDLAHPLSNRLIRSSASGISNSSCHYSNSEAKTWDTSSTSVTSSPAQSRVDKWKNELAGICMRCGLHEVDRDTARLGDESPFALSRKRPMSAQGDAGNALELAPLHIRNAKKRPTSELIQMPSPQPPTAWGYIQAVMEVQANNYELAGWDQFTHLRDFIEVGSEAPTARRASTIF
ncbi:hypothetical protein E0Z10_g6477 [Xylaria hypoxylon]|uniref:Uncharacterized protein n=1 Tax=Xylaria hypoxylon TaxID=37992 RepID=A0A4Z0YT68_9PEZI|nr:hypothetical protein E0Z10_g6477 [Xylaria hypoxylon]